MSDALLDAAVNQFGDLGLAGASTRAIAAAAGTAMSTITYRHGGKDGLYLAAADYIAQTIGERMRPALAARLGAPLDRILGLVRGFTALMLSEESRPWARFIIREQMQPTAAFDRLWDGAMREVLDVLAGEILAATGRTDVRAARLTAMTFMGQALVFRAARAAVMRALDREELDPEDVLAIHVRIEANIRAILTAEAVP